MHIKTAIFHEKLNPPSRLQENDLKKLLALPRTHFLHKSLLKLFKNHPIIPGKALKLN